MVWIGAGCFFHNVIGAVHFVMPRTSVPMIVTREIQNAAAFHIERHIAIVCKLVKKVTGVGAFVCPAAIVSAAHVSTDADALHWPAIPLTIRVQANGNFRWLDCSGTQRQQKAGKNLFSTTPMRKREFFKM